RPQTGRPQPNSPGRVTVTDQRRDTRPRFEQWARNPSCKANAVSAVLGVPMVKVADADGVRPTMGQSPFAIARGLVFERSLFNDNAARLCEALIKAQLLPNGATG